MSQNANTKQDWKERLNQFNGIWVLKRHKEEIESFIQQELKNQKKEIIKKIENLEPLSLPYIYCDLVTKSKILKLIKRIK